MTSDKEASGGFSLRRWSQRKLAASREARADAQKPPAPPAPAGGAAAEIAPPAATSSTDAGAAALPSVDSLTSDSDFTPFMRADVEPGLQHQALRKLFSDPRFNVMDGLDTYIDDYSKPDPIAPDVVAKLAQARYLFDPPATRVDENGVVVDVPAPVPAVLGAAPDETAPLLPVAAEPASPATTSGAAALQHDVAGGVESARAPDAGAPDPTQHR